MSESVFLQALVLVCGTVAFVASLRFLRGFLELRHERRLSIASDELQQYLQRIEVAVEATAVEVERISEAQRFVTRLLADRGGAPNPAGPPARLITPH
jgi:hypothetical protein